VNKIVKFERKISPWTIKEQEAAIPGKEKGTQKAKAKEIRKLRQVAPKVFRRIRRRAATTTIDETRARQTETTREKERGKEALDTNRFSHHILEPLCFPEMMLAREGRETMRMLHPLRLFPPVWAAQVAPLLLQLRTRSSTKKLR
jgi:hypothetical protein